MGKNSIYNAVIWGILSFLTLSGLYSCSNDEDQSLSTKELIGTWYGTRAYYNPASGTKYQYLTLTLDDDGIGELEYETPSGYSFVKFTYKISKGKIQCKGIKASTGDYEVEDFEMTLSIEGNRLIPLDKYSFFILTKDNSVMTDGDGNEVLNDKDLVNNVWIRSDGYSVCVIDKDRCIEYMLLEKNGNIYSQKNEYYFSYDNIRRLILFGTTEYEVITLSSTTLEIKNKSSYFLFTSGSQKDIPTNGENSNDTDMLKILASKSLGWKTKYHEVLSFLSDGRTFYWEQSSKKLGSTGYITLVAKGTFAIKDKKITCNYTEVEWEAGNDLTKNWFSGWSYGTPRIRIYTIKYISMESIILEADDGKQYILEPV